MSATLCLLLSACAAKSWPDSDERLLGELKAGGLVLLMAHAQAASDAAGPPRLSLEQCAARQHLSAIGQRQAQRLAARMQTDRIVITRVLTSHDCRSLETAALAFGRAEPWSILDDARTENRGIKTQKAVALREAISRWSYPGNLVLVSHRGTIRDALGIALQPGELLLIKPLGDAGFRVLGGWQPQ